MSIRAPVGPTNLADQRYCIGRGLAAIRLQDPLCRDFILHFLRFSVSSLVDQATGTTFDAIGGEVLRGHRVPVPPLAEQRRIVEALDDYLSRIDAAVGSLERAQAKLKAYRASVLKAAVEGRLVPTEAEVARQEKRDYEPAQVLLSRILKERRRRWEEAELAKLKASGRTPRDDRWKAKYQEPEGPDADGLPELPEGWCWARAEQVSEFITKGTTPSATAMESEEGEVPFVKVYNLTFDGSLDFDSNDPTFVSNDVHRGFLGRSVCRPGAVLMNIVGPPLGKVSLVPATLFEPWKALEYLPSRFQLLPAGRGDMNNAVLTIREVADYLKVNEKTVYGLAQKRRIPAFKVGGQRRFRRADLDAWISAQTAYADPPAATAKSRPRRRKGRS